MIIDLTDYIAAQSGAWVSDPSNRQPNRLTLDVEGDSVTLSGFLRIRVTFELRNITLPASDLSRITGTTTATATTPTAPILSPTPAAVVPSASPIDTLSARTAGVVP